MSRATPGGVVGHRRRATFARPRTRAVVGGVVDGCEQLPLEAVFGQCRQLLRRTFKVRSRGRDRGTAPDPDRVPMRDQILRTNSRWDDADNRGVSDPAVGLGAAFALHERGRSRPVSCHQQDRLVWTGGTRRRPTRATVGAPALASTCGCSALTAPAVLRGARAQCHSEVERGPTALWRRVPLLGPPSAHKG
jgi:hypothetical protein